MPIISLKTGTKSRSLLVGNPYFQPSSYESIASATGTGSSGTITFSSIPSTYASLQIRWMARDTSSTGNTESILVRYNNDSSTAYAYHYLQGNGSAASASGIGFADTSWNIGDGMARGALTAGIMGTGIIDIHDYASTTKLKTSRAFVGLDNNSTAGKITLWSSLYNSTSAINRIDIISGNASFNTSTVFSLYGIKGA